jgi:hypothetical protein
MRKPNLLWKHCTCTVGRSISECVSHLEPLGGWKNSTPYYFEPSLTFWASTFFNFHPGGNCLTMLCFLWKWPLWCRLQNFRDATWNSGSSSCPTFPSAGVTRWVVALNLKASIIIIHQARFGVKIPLPPSCGMGPWIALKNLHDSSPLDWKAITDNVSWPFQFLRIL